MIDRRRFVGAGVCGALLVPLVANAQPREKVARVGFLTSSPREAMQGNLSAMGERLRELGYVEGRNLVVDYRQAETEEAFRDLAKELVAAGSQVIFAHGPYALRGSRAASESIARASR